MKKRVFITGAAGFIGFHLACSLKARGDEVIGFDNFNEYYSTTLKKARTRLLHEKGVPVIQADICDYDTLFKAVTGFNTTHLVHLAAQAGVRYSLVHPQAFVNSNLNGFVNILEVCRHTAVKLTYASSSSVYGLNSKVPFAETDPCDHPANLYGATKKANEVMAFSYHHLYGVCATGLRFFTVYGPWGRPDMAYFKFAEAILQNKPIEIFNHGKMERDFTYIDDIITGTIAALDLESPYEIFNLGHHHPEKLLTLVELLESLLERKAQKVFFPMQPGDVLSTYADIEHSKKSLHFDPKIPLATGLRRFVEWFKRYAKIDS